MYTIPLPRVGGIYRFTCIPTKKIYVGSTRDLRKRHTTHIWQLSTGKHCNSHLQRAWDKYGADAFCFDILEYTPDDRLVEREQFFLDTLKPWDDAIGFNCSIYVDSPTRGRKATPEMLAELRARRHSDETKARISAATKGRPVSEETRQKKSLIQKGKSVAHLRAPETIAKSAATRLGSKQSETAKLRRAGTNLGYKHTPESIKNMSAAAKARFSDPDARARVGAASRGRVQSPEARAKNAESQRQRQAKLRAIRQSKLPLVQLTFDLDQDP